MNPHITNTTNPVDFPSEPYVLRWIFRNGHEWTQTFPSELERAHWLARVGLLNHTDIVQVTEINPDGERDLKPVG
jgi:hypothetical protein